jgi:hypothetical protein
MPSLPMPPDPLPPGVVGLPEVPVPLPVPFDEPLLPGPVLLPGSAPGELGEAGEPGLVAPGWVGPVLPSFAASAGKALAPSTAPSSRV